MTPSQHHRDIQPPDPLTRVLHGLRDTHPTPGLEARLQQHLQAHLHPTPAPAAVLLPWPHRLSPFAWLPLAALAGVLLLLTLSAHRQPAPVPPAAHATSPAILPPAAPAAPPSVAVTPLPRRHLAPARQPATLAVAETAAPSHPPPPLPITREERLIQRFVSRHTATAVAALAPGNEPAHEAADRRDFQDFFNPPPDPQPTLTPSTPTPPPTPQEPQP